MIQGGDPKLATARATSASPFRTSLSPTLNFHQPGVLAMANTGSPHTGACQFFITAAATAVAEWQAYDFGQVVEGQEVADKIVAVPRNRTDKPRTAVFIKTITFWRVGPAPANDPLGPARRTAPAKPKA